MIRRFLSLVVAVTLICGLFAAPSAPQSADYVSSVRERVTLSDKIGVAHIGGYYNHTNEPYLLEGAKAIKTLGSNVIKVSLSPEKYRFNNNADDWPFKYDEENGKFDEKAAQKEAAAKKPNLVDVLKLKYYNELFNMGFNTYVLQAQADTTDSHDWALGLSQNDWEKQVQTYEDNYYNAAKYLLEKYHDTDKEFYFEQWEADLYYFYCMKDPKATKNVEEA